MADEDFMATIDRLVAEERELRARATGEGLDAEGRERLRDLERRLDQCWDLLRQRRARAEFGEDPDQAKARPTDEVGSYLQ
ncbi:Protein of unknown function [Amycolatopsis arida]|uniref:DUF2630 domain-containing protein n=1 Tax=Amycolatopsis arida TaxID=587909 RepID=A0A1I5XDR4_9PSEU|nr:DUF2630 family protein [Amycolatopsis arida]TDX97510.1 uncharacterized protein DUF2630 [Amycolatopsis arida]SFQ30123.1 Protein of unknown function [Amycolatopsis arida]